ncbi:MAG: sporulation protein YtxC, partial [Tumebacillaceae bacterium]
ANERLKAQGIELRGERFTRGKYTFYTYRLSGSSVGKVDEPTDITVQALAEAVADFVTGVWERHELGKIVSDDFYFYGADEVEYLTGAAMQMLAELVGPDGKPLRHVHIALQAAEQLAQGRDLVIDGLLRFRMQAWQEDLHRVIEQAIDEYLLDLEYQEFVKLLKYFLSMQEPGMPVLHMICVDEGTTRLFNAEGKPLGIDDLVSVAHPNMLQESGISVEDMMSVLISLAPEKLFIHVVQGPEQAPPVVETVKKVFAERAVSCGGCPLCAADQWENLPHVTERNRQ